MIRQKDRERAITVLDGYRPDRRVDASVLLTTTVKTPRRYVLYSMSVQRYPVLPVLLRNRLYPPSVMPTALHRRFSMTLAEEPSRTFLVYSPHRDARAAGGGLFTHWAFRDLFFPSATFALRDFCASARYRRRDFPLAGSCLGLS